MGLLPCFKVAIACACPKYDELLIPFKTHPFTNPNVCASEFLDTWYILKKGERMNDDKNRRKVKRHVKGWNKW